MEVRNRLEKKEINDFQSETDFDSQDEISQSLLMALERLPEAIILLDKDLHILWANDGSAKLFSIQNHTDTGRLLNQRMSDPDILQLIKKFFINDREAQSEILDSPLYDDEYLRVDVINLNENHIMLLGMDQTDQVTTQQIRMDFVANASHELRTPLTVINGYIELLIDNLAASDKNKVQKNYFVPPLEAMHTQSQRIMNIINDLLLLSKSDHAVQKSSAEGVDVSQVIHQIESDAKKISNHHTVNIFLTEKRRLLGNETLIQSLIANLVFNALNHTPHGTTIDLKWQPSQTSNGAELIVTDNGQGIPPQHISRVTERFYRVDKSHSRLTANQGGGTGLGLAIVKHAVTSSGGNLHIESTLGEGSTFTCSWPVESLYI